MKKTNLILILLLVFTLLFTGCRQKPTEEPTSTAPTGETQDVITADEMLTLWTADAAARKALVEYLDAISDESGPDFIPVEDRIAVFDLDGTLFCETDPNYFDYTLLVYRVLEDPDYKDKASDFEKETANKIVEQNATGATVSSNNTDSMTAKIFCNRAVFISIPQK